MFYFIRYANPLEPLCLLSLKKRTRRKPLGCASLAHKFWVDVDHRLASLYNGHMVKTVLASVKITYNTTKSEGKQSYRQTHSCKRYRTPGLFHKCYGTALYQTKGYKNLFTHCAYSVNHPHCIVKEVVVRLLWERDHGYSAIRIARCAFYRADY